MKKTSILLALWAVVVFVGVWKIMDLRMERKLSDPLPTETPITATQTPAPTVPISDDPNVEIEQALAGGDSSTQPQNPSEGVPSSASTSGKDYKSIFTSGIGSASGNVQWGFKDYNTGQSHISSSSSVPSASVIKVFIMEYIYANGLNLNESVGGKTISSLIEAMITYSDNTSTNTLIDHIGMNTLNSYFQSQGYNGTRLERKMLDTAAQAAGKENYTSINDVMAFLDKVYQNKNASPYSQMLSTLKKQQVKTKIPRNLPSGVVTANKTGELSNVENDIGFVFTDKGDFAIAFLCTSVSAPGNARDYISNTTLSVYNEFIK